MKFAAFVKGAGRGADAKVQIPEGLAQGGDHFPSEIFCLAFLLIEKKQVDIGIRKQSAPTVSSHRRNAKPSEGFSDSANFFPELKDDRIDQGRPVPDGCLPITRNFEMFANLGGFLRIQFLECGSAAFEPHFRSTQFPVCRLQSSLFSVLSVNSALKVFPLCRNSTLESRNSAFLVPDPDCLVHSAQKNFPIADFSS